MTSAVPNTDTPAPDVLLRDRTPAHAADPLVSVVIPSYNVGAWLKQTVDSVLAQRTSFAVEVVISDDASRDDSVAIARSYKEAYPHLVHLLLREKNVGMQRNYYGAFEQARGKYIAWLDGDDYWTDPLKLELQVQALEADPGISMCGHYVRWVSRGPTGKVERERYPRLPPGRYGLETILRSNFLPSPSVVFRNGLQRDLPEFYFDLAPIGDWPVHIMAAHKGDILLLDRIMADYTLNATSNYWSEGAQFWYQNDIRFYDAFEGILSPELKRLVRAEKGRRYESLSYSLRQKGEYTASRRAAVGAFRSPRLADNIPSKCKTLLASLVREAQWRISGSGGAGPLRRAR